MKEFRTVTINLLLADDQEMVRRGVRRIVESQPDITVVGEAADGVTAVEMARSLRPDVVLLDIRMPRMDGIEVTRTLSESGCSARIVILTTFDLDEYVYPALRHGACGFLIKRSGPALIVEAVRAAYTGESLISPSVTVRLLQHIAGEGLPRTEAPSPAGTSRDRAPMEALTEREIEIAGQVAGGKTNADIAGELFISAGTVKTHVASIQRKLGAKNRVGVAVWAWEMGYAGGNTR